MLPQQPHQMPQQLYGYQGGARNKPPAFGPGSGTNEVMVGPHMTSSYGQPNMGQQPPNQGQGVSEVNMTSITQLPQQQSGSQGQPPRSKHVQPSPQLQHQHPHRQQTPQQKQQGQAQASNLPLHDFSHTASAIPSPFNTNVATPTGSASAPTMSMQGVPPGTVPLSANDAHTNWHAVPLGPVPVATSATGPGTLSGSPVRQNSIPQNFHSVPGVPQPQLRRYVPFSTMPYPIRKYLSNMAILRLHEIINLINVSTGSVNDFDYWKRFTSDLFTLYGILRYSTKAGEETRQFEFTTPIIPLICQSLASVGVVRLEIVPQQLRAQVLSNGTIFFDCPRCTITFYYPDGSYMTNFSQVKGIFDSTLKIIWVEISSYSFVPGIEWSSLERLISSEILCHQIFKDLSKTHEKPQTSDQDPDQQPTSGGQEPQMPTNFAAITKLRSQFKVFHNISSFGVQESFMRALQVNDVISYLKNLKVYQKVHNLQSPLSSLEALVASSHAEKSAGVPASAPPKYHTNGVSPAAQPSNMRARVPQPSRPVPKKRRQSDVSPLSTGEEDATPKQDLPDVSSDETLKKVKY
ncbi:LAME_0F15874g1_1 [Lachancea meyersii CBS 8951]|uniref:LAME_0F15874g1_1 n=1 Tax=Lachancea meyersii CBS 8951 TaxID=1266667 RepID=A0A1G4JYS3_9SACH|nr:LAME_0F15874g1_1 [Lachancea meyersii CBS 8951]